MTIRRVLVLVGVTMLAGLGIAYLFGLSQMGDCLEGPRDPACIAGKVRDGRVAIVVGAAIYVGVIWRISRQWKDN